MSYRPPQPASVSVDRDASASYLFSRILSVILIPEELLVVPMRQSEFGKSPCHHLGDVT